MGQLAERSATDAGSVRGPKHERSLRVPAPVRSRTADDERSRQPSKSTFSARESRDALNPASEWGSTQEGWPLPDSVTSNDRSGETRTVLAQSAYMLRRRYLWVIMAVFLACGVATGAFLGVPPTQQSSAAVLFVPSITQPGVTGPTNPLLSLGNSLAIVASVVQIAVSDDETMQKLAAAGYDATYKVVQDLSENSGPVLLITVEDVSPQQAQGTRDALVAEIGTRLKALQDERKVPQDLRVTTVLLTSSREPTLVHKMQIRLAFVVGFGTLGFALAVILVLERRSARRPSEDTSTDVPASVTNAERPPNDPGVTADENTFAAMPDPPV